MTPEAFRAWQEHSGLSGKEISEALGKSTHTIVRYRQSGVPAEESTTVRLALRAISNALPPWPAK
ncbi:hypothetical protein V5F77_05200 [Xanthobacter sp. DSM 24535]|uniref:hypothetical protein n=1 Tax=Roseixanthobacter psychrophilus TaxID=3119917 RepID=UPI0037275966